MGNYTRKGALLLSLVMAMSSVSIAATAVDVTAEDEAAAVVASQSADNAVSVQSDDPETINITDDDGYVWNGYYNDDGTITITGTQQLWGNAYTDKGSESSKDALIIPESIGGKTVTGINSYMTTRRFDTGFNDNVIRKIVFPKTVTTIDCYSVWNGHRSVWTIQQSGRARSGQRKRVCCGSVWSCGNRSRCDPAEEADYDSCKLG